MTKSCIKRLSETTFICVMTGLIVYEAYLGQHEDHSPHSDYPTAPPVQSVTIVGTATISTSTTTTF